MAHIQIRALILALTCASVLAQLEPDLTTGPTANVVPTTTTTTNAQQQVSLTALFRELAAAKAQQRGASGVNTQNSIIIATTTDLPVTTIKQQQQQKLASNVPSQTPTALPQEPSQLISTPQSTVKPQYQFVKPVTVPKCYYNNQTYLVGQNWQEDCEKVCQCVLDASGLMAINACEDRCPKYHDPPGDNCQLQRSKSDQCCLEWSCSSAGMFAPSTMTTIMNTEQGQLNVSTTEIKFSSNEPPQTAATAQLDQLDLSATTNVPPTSLAPVANALTSSAPQVTSIQQSPSTPKKPKSPNTLTSQQQVPTTTALPSPSQQNRPKPTSESSPIVAITSPPTGSNRLPKQAPQDRVITTLLPVISPNQKAQALVTTTNQPTTTSTTTTTTTESYPAVEEVDPSELDLCIQSDLSAYKIGQVWADDVCNQTCRCVFKSEPRRPMEDMHFRESMNGKPNSSATEIRCGPLPNCPRSIDLTSRPDCPNPRLILPQLQDQDKCACPQVTCSPTTESVSNFRSTERTTPIMQTSSSTNIPTTTSLPVQGCRSKQQGGRLFSIGETFNDECHSTCRCFEDGEIRCQQLACPTLPTEDNSCEEWIVEPNFKPNSADDKCCPQFVCSKPVPKFASCILMGKMIKHKQKVPEEIQPPTPDCEKECTCLDGQIICSCPLIGDSPPDDFICPSGQAFKSLDGCCPRWLCRAINYELQQIDIQPINATAVDISLVLPTFALGQKGKLEVNYTGIPADSDSSELPPPNAHWQRRANIKPEDGIFTKSITYKMAKLKPNYVYWFKVAVHFFDVFEPFNEPLESGLIKISMPSYYPEPADSTEIPVIVSPAVPQLVSSPASTSTSTSTSTTTTTTTTVPPTMIIQPIVPNRHPSQTHHSSQPAKTTLRPVAPTMTTTTTVVPSSTTTLASTTTEQQAPSQPSQPIDITSTISSNNSTSSTTTLSSSLDIIKPDVSQNMSPCSKNAGVLNNNDLEERVPPRTEPIYWGNTKFPVNDQLQQYAWLLLIALIIMTILFLGACCACLKKSARVIAPITSQSAYDNPTFTKLVSYYPPHVLLVDENNQNYNNDAILAKQKNLEVDKSSPLHHHQMNDIHHHNGRQHLI